MIKNRSCKNILFLLLIVFTFYGCNKSEDINTGNQQSYLYSSYLDIPGITQEEILAIQQLQKERELLTYGMILTTEAFLLDNGQVGGFSALFCRWMSELFGIPFRVEIIPSNELVQKLNEGKIDFSGNMMFTEERQEMYFMSDTIAERQFITVRHEDSRTLDEILKERPLKFIFMENTPMEGYTASILPPGTYDPVFVGRYEDSYELLKNGRADAVIATNATRISFIDRNDLIIEDFFPVVFIPTSVATVDKSLESIITVLNKALRNGASRGLIYLYNQGYQDYLKYKISALLTSEERAYINKYVSGNTPVPITAYNSNYPLCFYNSREHEWQGIYFEILREVTKLTGLTFEVAHDETANWPLINELMTTGQAFIIPEVVQTRAREEFYIWSDYVLLTDYYALVSRADYRNITLNEIRYEKVGVATGTTHAIMFKSWFPNNENTVEYEGIDFAFDALLRGEVDMVMTTQRRLMHLTHFREIVGYKANVVFDQPIETRLAFAKDAQQLRSIVDKSLGLIDYDGIAVQWTQRTYDYRVKLFEAQRPWLFSAIALSMTLITLTLIFLYKNHKKGKRLEKLVDEVKKANHAKTTFLASMSHEIRTPMNAILGVTEIQLHKENISQDTEEALNTIYDSGNLLLNIINDILDLSKIEAGRLEINPYIYDILSLLYDTIQLNRLRYESKPIDFKLDIDENMPHEMFGDGLRIKQIINNLLSNAFKYTEKGEIEFSASFESVNDTDVIFIINVKDTGQGMTEEQIKKLFDEYTRFNLETNRTIVGAGLGMNITKRFVEMMSGEITVKSQPDKGTQFTVRLPQKRVGFKVCGNDMADKLLEYKFQNFSKIKKAQIMREYMPYGNVLIVDDVESNLYVAKGLMLPYGLKIDTAASGFEAIEKIKNENKYDIIFMDHMMPKMDGVETVKNIREMNYKHPIIALTANAVSGQAEMFLANGFDGFISKPVDFRELNAVLNTFIRDKQSPEVLEEAQKEKEKRMKNNEQKSSATNEMKKVFIHDAIRAVNILEILNPAESPLDNENLQLYTVTVHGMKSVLSNIGEKELSELALKLEKAGRSRDKYIVSNETKSFVTALKALIIKLKPIEENSVFKLTDEEKNLLCEKMLIIKTASAEYDINTAKNALSELKQRKWPQKVNEALDSISEHLLHSAVKQAISVTDDVISWSPSL